MYYSLAHFQVVTTLAHCHYRGPGLVSAFSATPQHTRNTNDHLATKTQEIFEDAARAPQERRKSAARAKQSTDSRQLGGSVGRIWFSRQFVLYVLFPTGNHRHDIPQRVCNSHHGQNMKPASGFRLTTAKATRKRCFWWLGWFSFLHTEPANFCHDVLQDIRQAKPDIRPA